jgi:hypothetical protein
VLYSFASDSDVGCVEPPVPLFDIEIEATMAMTTPFTFDVSPDGQRFLLPRLTRAERDHLVVIQNWEELLAR